MSEVMGVRYASGFDTGVAWVENHTVACSYCKPLYEGGNTLTMLDEYGDSQIRLVRQGDDHDSFVDITFRYATKRDHIYRMVHINFCPFCGKRFKFE